MRVRIINNGGNGIYQNSMFPIIVDCSVDEHGVLSILRKRIRTGDIENGWCADDWRVDFPPSAWEHVDENLSAIDSFARCLKCKYFSKEIAYDRKKLETVVSNSCSSCTLSEEIRAKVKYNNEHGFHKPTGVIGSYCR